MNEPTYKPNLSRATLGMLVILGPDSQCVMVASVFVENRKIPLSVSTLGAGETGSTVVFLIVFDCDVGKRRCLSHHAPRSES